MTVLTNYFRLLFSQCSHLSLLPCPGTRKMKIMLGTSTGISGVGKNFVIASDLCPAQNRFVHRACKVLTSLVQHQFCFLLSIPTVCSRSISCTGGSQELLWEQMLGKQMGQELIWSNDSSVTFWCPSEIAASLYSMAEGKSRHSTKSRLGTVLKQW